MKLLSSLFAPLLFASLASGASIYTETFTSQEGKGYDGTSVGDFTGVDWTISGDSSGITASDDWFTVDGAQMSVRDIDATLTWNSPTIDISSVTDPLSLTIDLGASGDFEISGDVFNVYYKIDTDTPVLLIQATVDEDAPGDPFFVGSTELTSTLAAFSGAIVGSGSDLVIMVEASNNAGTEFQFFDNVTVETVPEPTTALLGSLGLLALLRRRRA